ncbi:hypothetical protein ACHAQA_000410 [Verticillium albo-atrum]
MSVVQEITTWLDIDPDSPVMVLFWTSAFLLALAFLALAAFVISQWTEWYVGRFGSVAGPPRDDRGPRRWLAQAAYLGLYLDGCGLALVLVVLSPALAIVAMTLAPFVAVAVGIWGMGGDEEGEKKTTPLLEKKGQ